MLNDESVLVRPDAALAQIEADEAAKREFTDQGGRIFTPPGDQPPLGGDGLGGDAGGASRRRHGARPRPSSPAASTASSSSTRPGSTSRCPRSSSTSSST